jgi:hypothetical protein
MGIEDPSDAATTMSRTPEVPTGATPENCPLSKASQLGSAVPSASVAVKARVSPSGSTKLLVTSSRNSSVPTNLRFDSSCWTSGMSSVPVTVNVKVDDEDAP